MDALIQRLTQSPDVLLILALLLLLGRDKKYLPLVLALGYILLAPENGSAELLSDPGTQHPDINN